MEIKLSPECSLKSSTKEAFCEVSAEERACSVRQQSSPHILDLLEGSIDCPGPGPDGECRREITMPALVLLPIIEEPLH